MKRCPTRNHGRCQTVYPGSETTPQKVILMDPLSSKALKEIPKIYRDRLLRFHIIPYNVHIP